MRTIIKIVLIIGVFVVAIPLFAITKDNPILKLILVAALFGGIRAIWIYNPDKDKPSNNEEDEHQLDKS